MPRKCCSQITPLIKAVLPKKHEALLFMLRRRWAKAKNLSDCHIHYLLAALLIRRQFLYDPLAYAVKKLFIYRDVRQNAEKIVTYSLYYLQGNAYHGHTHTHKLQKNLSKI